MQIFIKPSTGNTFICNDVHNGQTIREIKEKCYNKKICDKIYFIYNGRILYDEEKVEDHNLIHGSTVFMNVRANKV